MFVLIGVAGLERLSLWNEQAARILLFLCAAHFLFWYGLHASRDEELYAAMTPFETWDAINHGDPQGRIAIRPAAQRRSPASSWFSSATGRSTSFRSGSTTPADIDGARIVWARDLGPDENQKLLRYYPDRTAWLLEPDAHPPAVAPLPTLIYHPVCSIRSRITALYSFICAGFRFSGAGMIAANRAACSRVISDAWEW